MIGDRGAHVGGVAARSHDSPALADHAAVRAAASARRWSSRPGRTNDSCAIGDPGTWKPPFRQCLSCGVECRLTDSFGQRKTPVADWLFNCPERSANWCVARMNESVARMIESVASACPSFAMPDRPFAVPPALPSGDPAPTRCPSPPPARPGFKGRPVAAVPPRPTRSVREIFLSDRRCRGWKTDKCRCRRGPR